MCALNKRMEAPPLSCICLFRYSLHAAGKPWCATCKTVCVTCSRENGASGRHIRIAQQALGRRASSYTDALVQHARQLLRDHSPSSQAATAAALPIAAIDEAAHSQATESEAATAHQEPHSLAAASWSTHGFSTTYQRPSKAAHSARETPDVLSKCGDAGKSRRKMGTAGAGCCHMHVRHACHMHEPGTDARIWICDVWCASHICNILCCICLCNQQMQQVMSPFTYPLRRTIGPRDRGSTPKEPVCEGVSLLPQRGSQKNPGPGGAHKRTRAFHAFSLIALKKTVAIQRQPWIAEYCSRS